MSYIEELRDIESVPVKAEFEGKTFWQGVVEVFALHRHPKADKVYAWAHEVNNPGRPDRHVAVLHGGVVDSPLAAVQVAIVQELRNLGTEESQSRASEATQG